MSIADCAHVLAIASAVSTQFTADKTQTPSSFGFITSILALLFVIALIFAISWLVKRLPGLSIQPRNDLKIIAHLAVGSKERLVIVQIKDKQLLLGVASGHISLIDRLNDPLPQTTMRIPKPFVTFSTVLAKKMKKIDALQ